RHSISLMVAVNARSAPAGLSAKAGLSAAGIWAAAGRAASLTPRIVVAVRRIVAPPFALGWTGSGGGRRRPTRASARRRRRAVIMQGVIEASSAAGRARDRKQRPDRNLALELVRVTEAAALAAAPLVGLGDKEAADQAAVDGMRHML